VLVVGVGASAGGISALEGFFQALRSPSGLVFIVVQHLDPNHESILPRLIAKTSNIPVIEIEAGTTVEPDHVYVAPPNATVTLMKNQLRLEPPAEERGRRTPIDSLFFSLAEQKGEAAACVILSGTGSDGTQGLRAIKEHGGLTIAQENAEYDGMMRSAVRTGMVDYVLPLEEIPPRLEEYVRHLTSVDPRKGPDGLRQETTDHLAQVCTLLRMRTGHDFSGYKDKTVARRIQRRMQVLQIGEVPDFLERLQQDPQEIDALLQDLLIGVTSFFRDPPAFEALEREVVPQLFEGKKPEDTIRVWVPGCATGEEAYSIAILLREHMEKTGLMPKVQIFASDIDELSLQVARFGRYPSTIARDVTATRLNRFFVREDGTYRIVSDLREICLFSAHSLLRDAPFSKLDLISCRNLLIYLTPDLQNRLIPLFHYALKESGFLMLGLSENVTKHSRLFATIDKAHRIFRRRPQVERRLPEFPLTTHESARRKAVPLMRNGAEPETVQSVAERQLVERYAPAYVVINADGDVLHGSHRTGKYLELSAGTPRTDIFSLARIGLRADLRATIHKSISTRQIAVQRNVVVGTNGGRQTIDLVVHPLPMQSVHEPLFMVVFQDVGGLMSTADPDTLETVQDMENASLQQLELELRATRDRLQTVTEELESSNEELKSGNEELSSMNEELQSANEELETSKEELQSINEELQTVNFELNARVEELSRANSDIANLLESTQIATVFLDRSLTIKSFTPAAKDVFRLVESDTGRPLTHVRARFSSDTVQEDAERVLRTLATIERQVQSNYSDLRYIMRMMPYRTVDNVIGGVVITFVDVTRITAAEERIGQLTHDLRNRVQSLETLLDLLPVGILIVEDNATEAVRVNRYCAQLLGVASGGPLPTIDTVRIFQHDREIPSHEHPLNLAARAGQAIPGFEAQIRRPDGGKADVLISASPMFDENSKLRGGIAAMVDITARRSAEAHQQVLLHELQHRVKNVISTISALAGRMLKSSTSLPDFSEAFLGRLRAMATTHELLSRGQWSGTELRVLIEATVQPYMASARSVLSLTGPLVLLTPGQAATLGLVLYELASNAAKYGALSTPEGHIVVSWKVSGANLSLSWVESGGPEAKPARGASFGVGFVRRSVEYELNGSADLVFDRDGLRCSLTFPLRENAK